ncbi:MAG: translation initiation factor IF-2 [Holosporales bacterium]|jgi:translation initiation factor IF-2|nr:translation initiation factor IF-2 [Holosporales bacterium]
MVSGNDHEDNKKRQTISLRSAVAVNSRKSHAGNRTVEVEIKRKRSGLTIEADELGSMENPARFSDASGSKAVHGNLTDQEFNARVKALRESMKEEDAADDIIQEKVLDDMITEDEATHAEVEQGEGTRGAIEVEAEVTPKTKPVISQKAKKMSNEDIVANSTPVVFSVYDPPKRDERPKQATGTGNQESDREKQPQPVINNANANTKARPRDGADDEAAKKRAKISVKSNYSDKKDGGKRVSRAVLNRVLSSDAEERSMSMAALRRARMKQKNAKQGNEVTKVIREVSIPDTITVGELANRMAVRSSEVIRYLMSTGTIATVNQRMDGDTAEVICEEFGHTPKRISESDIENDIINIIDAPEMLEVRPPIIAVMGHVDHGKTTLLDTLRKSNVARKEAGGITQGVGAYQITTSDGKKITCIDTPGHAAFAGMRTRGAILTDIIVLVVAADDGVKDQTVEVIRQAKDQNVPIIVAINKIDKPNTNIDKLKSELMTHDIILEDFGGDVLSVEISALHNKNLDGLMDVILLQAEMLELKANKNRKAVGTVLESRIDKGRGIIASVIIQHGKLSDGDIFVAGCAFGKVRAIYDDQGNRIETALPSDPVEIVGFNSACGPGDVLSVLDSEQKAREIAEYRQRVTSGTAARKTAAKSIDQMMSEEGMGITILNIFVKADVFGSLEAIVASIGVIRHPEIKLNIVDTGVGIISESDIDFAKNTSAIIVGFNTSSTVAAKNVAKLYGINILHHSVIYHMTEELKGMVASMLSPIAEERYTGTADVRKIFSISRIGTIAGCCVVDGMIKRSDSIIKVMRGGKCVFEGKIRSMKHEKDEIKESRQSHECGILADGFNDFIEGDQIECYEIILKARSVD